MRERESGEGEGGERERESKVCNNYETPKNALSVFGLYKLFTQ